MSNGSLEPPQREDSTKPTGSLSPTEKVNQAALVVPREREEDGTSRDVLQFLRAVKERLEKLERSSSASLNLLNQGFQNLSVNVENISETVNEGDETNIFGTDIELTAQEDIQAYKLVYADSGGAYLADITQINHKYRIAGISVETKSSGSPVKIRQIGIVENSGWSWTAGDVLFAGAAGEMSNERGSGVFGQPVGVALSPGKVLVLVDTPKQEFYMQDSLPANPDHPATLYRTGQYADPELVEEYVNVESP